MKVAFISLLLSTLAFSAAAPTDTAGRLQALERRAQQLVSDSLGGESLRSAEMKDTLDFMLVPALLVQEALREDVILTYPSN
jgi:hypothetical protein